jgi:hypothetical protein
MADVREKSGKILALFRPQYLMVPPAHQEPSSGKILNQLPANVEPSGEKMVNQLPATAEPSGAENLNQLRATEVLSDEKVVNNLAATGETSGEKMLNQLPATGESSGEESLKLTPLGREPSRGNLLREESSGEEILNQLLRRMTVLLSSPKDRRCESGAVLAKLITIWRFQVRCIYFESITLYAFELDRRKKGKVSILPLYLLPVI